MNNKLFIATHIRNAAVLDVMRERIEGEDFFDRYGDADLAIKEGVFGFKTVVPERDESRFRCVWRMLRCSYVYLPCGWHEDKCSRVAMVLAEVLGKRIIFEEDSRCRF